MIPFTFPLTAAAACLAKNQEFADELISVFNERLDEIRTEIGEAAAQGAHDADGWAGDDVQDAVDEVLADRPDAEELAAELVSIFNERLDEARTEIGETAAYAAREAEGWVDVDVRDAVADLLAYYTEAGDDVEPAVRDSPAYRPGPVGADADADQLLWEFVEFALCDLSARRLGDGADMTYRETVPVHRRVVASPDVGGVEVFENLPVPGRHLAMRAFEAAVHAAGGCFLFRCGSACAGESRDCYPHEALGRPDGDGWTLYYLVGLLSASRVKELVQEHFGPLDVPYGGENAA